MSDEETPEEARPEIPTTEIIDLPMPQPLPCSIQVGEDPRFPNSRLLRFETVVGVFTFYLDLSAARQAGAALLQHTPQDNGSKLQIAKVVPPRDPRQ